MAEQFQFFLDKAKIEFDKDLELKAAQALQLNQKTLAVAESVTGGLISEKLTAVPGSSEYFVGGAVSYHVRAKVVMTGIEPKIIADNGLVSEKTAIGMAQGIRKKLHTDIGIGVTGVAGPEPHDGQPVGSVYIALSDEEKDRVQHFMFEGSRSRIRNLAALAALKMVMFYFESSK